jgi:hypothetical protein
MAGDHYWLGDGFIRVEDWDFLEEQVVSFPCRAEAEAVARWLRRSEGHYLRAAPHPRYGVLPTRPGWRSRQPCEETDPAS